MLEVPDLSHLTPDEQQKILDVIKRQQDEEEKEKTMLRALQHQFEDYKSRIKTNAEESKVSSGVVAEDNGPVCALCFKTKFAEGCGHMCSFCEVRFCSRCGGRITIKSNKTMWVCNLCRKQKEMLTKSGAWYHKDTTNLAKNLKASADPPGKENVKIKESELDLVNDSSQQMTKKESPSDYVENSTDQPQVSTQIPKSSVLQELDGNCSSETTRLTTADARRQRTVTVPNFQSIPNQNSALARSVSLTNVNQSKQSLNEMTVSDVVVVRNPQVAQKGEQIKSSNRNSRVSEEVGDSEHEVLNRQGMVNTTNQPTKQVPDVDSLPQTIACKSTVKGDPLNDGHIYSKRARRYVSSGHHRNRCNVAEHRGSRHLKRNGSQSSTASSEDDVRSTTDYSSCGDGEKETSLSEYGPDLSDSFNEDFSGTPSSCACPMLENSYVALQDQLPVSWQPADGGRFLLGRLTLCKNVPSAGSIQHGAGTLLGLKVVGGKSTPSGRLGAFITKVRKGSLADTIGHLKPGDEILAWNGYCLQNATFDEVYEIVLESKDDSVVELAVSRPIRDIPRIPETRLRQTAESSSCSLDSERRDFEGFPGKPALGKLQIKIWYDSKSELLYVTAMRAVDLSMREGGLPRNPYLKMYLLPERSNSFKRRTKTAKKTLSPEWMQTFVYRDVRKDDLGAMALELTLWDFDRSVEANNKFMGEVIVDLGLMCLSDEPHWFHLMPLGNGMNQDYDTSNLPLMFSKSVSSEANFTEVSSEAVSNPLYAGAKDLYHANSSARSVPKRRLPHLPTASSQNTIAASDAGTLNFPSPTTTEPVREMERDVVGSSHCSDRSVKFETMSVDHTLQTFVGGVGPGQIVGRQALAMSSVGEIELAFEQHSGKFTVQVRRGHKFACRQGTRITPVYYVKVYMMSGIHRIAKKKTKPSVRSVSPTFNEKLVFESNQVGNTVQITIWADYGRMDSNVFTGSAQICLDNLDLSCLVTGRYKLFPSSSIFETSSYGPRQDSYSSFGSSSLMQS